MKPQNYVLLVLLVSLVAGLASLPAAWAQAPTDAAAEREKADRLYNIGKVEEAKAIYVRILPSFENDFEFNKRLAYIYFTSPKKELAQAARFYARAYRLNPEDREVEMNLGKAYSWTKQYAEAITVFRRVLARDPANAEARLELARAQNYSGQFNDAVASYRAYLKQRPGDRPARLELAQALSANKQQDEALAEFRYVLKLSPGNLAARIGVARILSWQGKFQESLQAFDEIVAKSPQNYEAQRGRAFVLYWLGRADEAKTMFAVLAQKNPSDTEVKETLARIARGEVGAPAPGEKPEVADLRLQAETAIGQNDLPKAIGLLQAAVKLAPEDSNLAYRLGQIYYWNKQWDPAIEIFQKLHAQQPANVVLLRDIANAQIGASKLAEAVESLRAYLQQKPDDQVTRLLLARAYSWAGRFDESAATYQQILKSDPNNFDSLLGLAQVAAWQGKYAEAVERFDAILRERPGDRDALLGKAQAIYWLGNAERALALLETMQRRFPQDPEIAGVLAALREAEHTRAMQRVPAQPPDIETLIRSYQDIIARHPNDVEALRMLGDLYARKENYNEAMVYYQRAAEQKPDDSRLIYALAQVSSWNRDFSRSVELYQKLLDRKPDNFDYRLELARVLSWSARYPEAAENYRLLLQAAPENKEVLMGLARVLSWSQQLEESLETYARLLQLDPKNHDGLIERARIYSWKGSLDTAVNLYDELLVQNPKDRDALLGKAQALQWGGHPREAKTILEPLRGELPQDRDVALAMAGAQLALGRRDLALRELDQVERMDPGNRDAENLRMTIRKQTRPELVLGFNPAVQIDDLRIYPYTATLYFSPAPTVRSYISGSVIQSTFPAPDGVAQGREVVFGTSWQANDRLILRGNIGVNSQSARELIATTSPFGFVQLAEGAPRTSNAVIGGGGITVIATDNMRFHFDVNRRFLNYLPRSIKLDINRVELRAAWDYRPIRRFSLHLDYYHSRYSDGNRQNGGNLWSTVRLVQGENFNLDVGYLYGVYTFSENPFTKPFSSGFFAPPRFQRHAATGSIYGKLNTWFGYNFTGTLGKEAFPQQLALSTPTPPFFTEVTRFRGDGSLRGSIDLTFNAHTTLTLGYAYARLAGLTQTGALAADIFSSHAGFMTLWIRF